jgi:hypothetical protein
MFYENCQMTKNNLEKCETKIIVVTSSSSSSDSESEARFRFLAGSQQSQ